MESKNENDVIEDSEVDDENGSFIESEMDLSSDELIDESIESVENADGGASSTKRQLVLVAAIFCTLALVIAGWWIWSKRAQTAEKAAADTPVVVSVSVAKVERQTIAGEVAAVGSITPIKQAIVSSNASGQIKGLKLLQNELVRRGELLATIDTRDLQAQIKESEAVLHEARLNVQTLARSTIPQADIQSARDLKDAEASVDNARNLYERRKDLYEKGGIALKDVEAAQLAFRQAEDNLKFLEKSKSLRTKTSNSLDLQTAQARVTQAEHRIKTLRTQINLAEIRAPITGFVIDQSQFDGEYATAGGKILTIADLSEVIVKTQFADTVISKLKVGDAVAVYPDDLNDERMSGKVSLISRSTDPQNRATEIWVNLSNGTGRLRSGSAANVVVSENEQVDALVVPNSAVSLDTSNSKTGIAMIVDKANVAHERKVTIGIRTEKFTQIVDGLKEGDTVIIDGNYALPDGTRVEIKQDSVPPAKGVEPK